MWSPGAGAPAWGLVRLAASCALLGGLFVVASEAMMLLMLEPGSTTPLGLATKGVRLAAFVLLLVALPGIYASRAVLVGRLGLVGFLLAFTGTALLAGDLWFEAFVYPFLVGIDPSLTDTPPGGTMLAGALVSFAAFLIGWALVGVAFVRTRAFPMGPSALLVAGALVAFPSPLFPPRLVVLMLAISWTGLLLRREAIWQLATTAAEDAAHAVAVPDMRGTDRQSAL